MSRGFIVLQARPTCAGKHEIGTAKKLANQMGRAAVPRSERFYLLMLWMLVYFSYKLVTQYTPLILVVYHLHASKAHLENAFKALSKKKTSPFKKLNKGTSKS